MQIIYTNLFNRQLPQRKETNRIFVHHTAGADNSAAEIHQMHIHRGWAGIGYHYIIRANGNLEQGRPESARGAHAGPTANNDSIGIGLTGNFNIQNRQPTIAQMNTLVRIIRDIKQRLGQHITVHKHSEVMATACPGRFFPWDELLKRLLTDIYTVKAGDTLFSIARRYRTTVKNLRTLNNLQTDILTIGQQLIIN